MMNRGLCFKAQQSEATSVQSLPTFSANPFARYVKDKNKLRRDGESESDFCKRVGMVRYERNIERYFGCKSQSV